jgi:hypothetical protein
LSVECNFEGQKREERYNKYKCKYGRKGYKECIKNFDGETPTLRIEKEMGG